VRLRDPGRIVGKHEVVSQTWIRGGDGEGLRGQDVVRGLLDGALRRRLCHKGMIAEA
jgi:hypothetical protein